MRIYGKQCIAGFALLAAWAAFGPAPSAAADDRGIEFDQDGLEIAAAFGPIRIYDPWLLETVKRIDEVLAADLPPFDLGPSLGVIDSCGDYLALLEKGAPPDHLIAPKYATDSYPLTDHIMIEMGKNSISREEKKRYFTKHHYIRDYYGDCANARLFQMAGPVTVSYFNEKFPAADIYHNYILTMPGSWTKPMPEWEFDELVVLSDRLEFHFYDYWYGTTIVQAMGDFTGDGILDLLVYNSEVAIRGTARSYGLMIVVRTQAGGRSNSAKRMTCCSPASTPAGSIPTGRRSKRG